MLYASEVVSLAIHSDKDDLLLSWTCLFSLFGEHVFVLFIEVFALYPFDIFRLKNMSFLLLTAVRMLIATIEEILFFDWFIFAQSALVVLELSCV